MIDKFKEEFQAKPVQFIAICIIMVLILALIIYRFKDYLSIAWPTQSKIEAARKELKLSQIKLLEALNEEYKLKMRQEDFKDISEDLWIQKRDGDPSLNVQKMINQAGKDADIEISSLGAAKITDLSDSIGVTSIQIRAKANLHDIVTFINAIDKIQPKAYWQNLYLRPDNPKNPVEIIMSGTVQFLVIKDEKVLKLLLAGKE
jgi:hypothetical protein